MSIHTNDLDRLWLQYQELVVEFTALHACVKDLLLRDSMATDRIVALGESLRAITAAATASDGQ